jgi:hypothetical protein
VIDEAEANAKTDDDIQGERWTTDELQRDFDVVGFMAPFVVVIRKSDGVKGSMEFRHSPRVYFNFQPDTR